MAKEKDSESIFDARMIITIILAIVIISAGVLGYKYLSGTQDPFAGSGQVAQMGDRVAINYTGMFEDGRVFDTSLIDVADNDVLYPKALSFQEKTGYQPLLFTIGENEVIDGFEEGVMNMGINQTKTIYVPPEKGYGDANLDLIEEMSLVEILPMYTSDLNISSFEDAYLLDAVVGTTVTEINWGWNATVYFVDEYLEEVILKHEPVMGEIIHYNTAWDCEVIGIDSSTNGGEITIRHLLTSSDANKIYLMDDMGRPFIVTDVDTDAGIAKLDFNREVVGKTLIFKITLVQIIEE